MLEFPDPGTIAFYLTEEVLKKILGSTVDYISDRVFTGKRKSTLANILANAEKKLGSRIDEPGRVPPKVLKEIIDEGTYTDNSVAVEYFGGVLASSRTPTGRDDRGARIAKKISTLSAYQLRTHYLIYSTIAHIFSPRETEFSFLEWRERMTLFFRKEGYTHSMDLSQDEKDKLPILLVHVFHGLASDGLIDDNVVRRTSEEMRRRRRDTSGEIVVKPSSLGAEVFLWAFGHGDKPLDYIVSDDFEHWIGESPKAPHYGKPDVPFFIPTAHARYKDYDFRKDYDFLKTPK